MSRYVYLNGSIIPEEQAMLPVTDLAIVRGYAIFDYFRVINRKPFLIDDYVERFMNSAQYTGLALPLTASKLKETVQQLIKKNEMENAGVRFVLTGGNSHNAFEPAIPNFMILYETSLPPTGWPYGKGIKVISHHYKREWSIVKSINYFTVIKLLPEIHHQNAMEVLYYYNGNILEASRSNIFIIKDGVLITPNENILFGVTRKKVIELAGPFFKIEKRNVSLAEALKADEAFITGSGRRIVPVIQIDEHKIGNGLPGVVTRKIMELFDRFEEEYLK